MDILKKLMHCRGVSGKENKVAETIAAMIKDYVDELHTDAMGNLIAIKHGSAASPKKLMLAGHMDEIGFIITHVEDNGYLRVQSIGGINYIACAYEPVIFESGIQGVLVPEAGTSGNDMHAGRFCIDIGAKDRKDALRHVKIGDLCAVPDRLIKLPGRRGFYAGRPFDDRIGCAIMVRALQEITACPNELCLAFTVQEEVGCRGAATAANAFLPDYSLAFDVTGSGDALKARPMEVSLGKGAAIKVKDSSVICDPMFVEYLCDLADKEKIPYQREILEGGGTDTCAMQIAGSGSHATAISVPTRYIHSNAETICKKDYDACVELTKALLERELP